MSKLLNQISDTCLYVFFHLLFFLVPLFFLPVNFELFEFNKMELVYFLASVILGCWLIKSVTSKKFQIARTPFDIPILLFLASQILSTIFSIDPHVSIFGYYSRFNGGLLSILTYIFLYYAFVSNFSKKQIIPLLVTSFLSALFVSVWANFEHFGHSASCLFIQGKFDVSCWVQDVKTRVFATLGQPNWLAAYMAILVPISLGMGLEKLFSSKTVIPAKAGIQSLNIGSPIRSGMTMGLIYFFLSFIFFLTLLFTQSRSGFIGITVALALFFIVLLFQFKKKIILPLLFVICCLLSISFIFGVPVDQLRKFTLPELNKPATTNLPAQAGTQPAANVKPPAEGILESGVTGSDAIRKIVWKGAIEIFKAYPVFGSGVETFAFSYYKYRPVEHNMTSEWDFLYNKAHNEYLNYLATTGTVGIATYLFFIIAVVVFSIKYQDTYYLLLTTSLLSAWLSILITNFFGFSVVVVQLFFYLIPALLVVLTRPEINESSFWRLRLRRSLPAQAGPESVLNSKENADPGQARMTKSITFLESFYIFLSVSLTLFLLFSIIRGWMADFYYADGYHASRANEYTRAYDSLKRALTLNSQEPVYYDEFSYSAATLAVGLSDDKDKSLSQTLTEDAILASDKAVETSPSNVNFWKSRTRVFYTLSQLDPKYLDTALLAIQKSKDLAPTDPKVRYNLALIYDSKGEKEKAIQEMENATQLKPDYREAYIAKALLYSKYKDKEKASASAQFILDKIDPNDQDAKKVIEGLDK